MDHGEGRLQIHALLRRRRVRRAGLEGRGAARTAPKPITRAGTVPLLLDAEGAAAEAQFRACRRPRVGDPRGDRQSARRAANSSTSAWTSRSITARSAAYLSETRKLPAVEIPSRYHSNWMDNAKAKFLLGWRPKYDLRRLDQLCLGLRAIRQRTAAGSGIRAEWQRPGNESQWKRKGGSSNEESTVGDCRCRDGARRRAGNGPEEDAGRRREGPRQRLLHGHGQGLRRLERGQPGFRIRVPLHRSGAHLRRGRRNPDRRRPDRPRRRRRHRDLAVERAGHGQAAHREGGRRSRRRRSPS